MAIIRREPTPEAAAPMSPLDRLVEQAPKDALLAAVGDVLVPTLTRAISTTVTSDRRESGNRRDRGEEPLSVEPTAALVARGVVRELQQDLGRFGPEAGRRLLRQAAARETVVLTRSFIASADLGPQLERYPERLLSRWWRRQCGHDALASRTQESLTGIRPASPARLEVSEVPAPQEDSR